MSTSQKVLALFDLTLKELYAERLTYAQKLQLEPDNEEARRCLADTRASIRFVLKLQGEYMATSAATKESI